MRKWIIAPLIIVLIVTLMACQKDKGTNYFVIGLKVNPDIDFIIDDNDKVVSYALKNEDAKIVAASLNLIGLTYQQALVLYMDEVIKTGYIDATTDMQAVLISLGHLKDAPEQKRTTDVFNFMFDYFKERLLPVVVLNQLTYDTSISELAQTLNLSLEHAKVYQALALLDPSFLIDSSQKNSHKQIFQNLLNAQKSSLEAITSIEKQAFNAIKAELVENNQISLEMFEEKKANDQVPLPLYSELRTAYQTSFEQRSNDYAQAKMEWITNVKDIIRGETPSYLAGEYVYEYAINLPSFYVINTYIVTLNADGTGRVKDSITSIRYSQTTSGNNACFWSFVDGQVHIRYRQDSTYYDPFEVRGNRLIYTWTIWEDGVQIPIKIVFKKAPMS